MAVLPEAIYRFNTFPIKTIYIGFFFFGGNRKEPQIHMESQWVLNSPSSTEKEKQGQRAHMS